MDEMLGKSRVGNVRTWKPSGKVSEVFVIGGRPLTFPEGSCNFFADLSYTYT